MTFDNVDFNEKFWKGKSKAEFIASESHHGLSEKQLEEAYDLINPKLVEKKSSYFKLKEDENE